ncbi:hypothetical protein RI367_000937 [Sorochytrium milnesiophthora]
MSSLPLSRRAQRLQRQRQREGRAQIRYLSYDLTGFRDGRPFTLTGQRQLDRWSAQAADTITVRFSLHPPREATAADSKHVETASAAADYDIVVSLRQMAKVFIGGQIWDSSFILSSWLLATASISTADGSAWRLPCLEGATVCEIGAGVGLVGIALAKVCRPPRHVVLTDMESVTTAVTQPNVDANVTSSSPAQDARCLQVRPLDWSLREAHVAQLASEYGHFDVVLACDCIYSEVSAVDLVLSLRDVCRLRPADLAPTRIYCVSEVRNVSIQDAFTAEASRWFDLGRLDTEGDHGWWQYVPLELRAENVRTVTSLGKAHGRVVIIGSGWAGFKLLTDLRDKYYDSAYRCPYSSAVGTLEFRAVIEPVRRYNKTIEFHQATCDAIDLNARTVHCTSLLDAHQQSYSLKYDHLIIAPGAESNTFGIDGVREHAFFLKDITDARKIRGRVIECFEAAMQPGVTEEDQLRLLHFQTVGGGPTGVEFSAELHDFVVEDLRKLYPSLMSKVQMTLYDVAPRILGAFDANLADYALKRFQRYGVKVRTGTRVKQVKSDSLVLESGEVVPFGMLVWATGITQVPLIRSMKGQLAIEDRSGRILTDVALRALDAEGKAIPGVYALGDCAVTKGKTEPATAQVASQKAAHLAKQLNSVAAGKAQEVAPFGYHHMGSMAYVGSWKAVVDFPQHWKPSGYLAWLVWRSAYLTKSVSLRNKCLIPMYWFLTWVFGRDVSRIG